jgi:hypothetical protein
MRIKPSYPRLRLDHPLARGLQLAYPVTSDSYLRDLSPNGYHGTMLGGVSLANGPCGPCLDFDGTNGRVDTGRALFPGTRLLAETVDEFTLSVRLLQRVNGPGVHVAKGGSAGGVTVQISIGFSDGSSRRPTFRVRGNNQERSGASLNRWHTITYRWIGATSSSQWFLDGQLQGNLNPGSLGYQSGNLFWGGQNHSGTSTNCDGLGEDLRVYSRALAEAEIEELHGNPWEVYRKPNKYWRFGSLTDGLRWNLDASKLELADGDPVETWPDSSPQVNHVTQANAAKQPIFRENQTPTGKPTVVFDGVNDDLKTNITPIEGSSPRTIYVVFMQDEGHVGNRPSPVCLSPDGAGDDRDRFGITTEYGVRVSASNRLFAKGATPGRWQLLQVRVGSPANMNNASFQVFGEALAVQSTSGGEFVLNTAAGGAAVGVYNLVEEFFKGRVSHVLAFANAHTPEQRQFFFQFLHEKWTKQNQDFETADALMPMLGEVVEYQQNHQFATEPAFMPQAAALHGYQQLHLIDTLDAFMAQDAELAGLFMLPLPREAITLPPGSAAHDPVAAAYAARATGDTVIVETPTVANFSDAAWSEDRPLDCHVQQQFASPDVSFQSRGQSRRYKVFFACDPGVTTDDRLVWTHQGGIEFSHAKVLQVLDHYSRARPGQPPFMWIVDCELQSTRRESV